MIQMMKVMKSWTGESGQGGITKSPPYLGSPGLRSHLLPRNRDGELPSWADNNDLVPSPPPVDAAQPPVAPESCKFCQDTWHICQICRKKVCNLFCSIPYKGDSLKRVHRKCIQGEAPEVDNNNLSRSDQSDDEPPITPRRNYDQADQQSIQSDRSQARRHLFGSPVSVIKRAPRQVLQGSSSSGSEGSTNNTEMRSPVFSSLEAFQSPTGGSRIPEEGLRTPLRTQLSIFRETHQESPESTVQPPAGVSPAKTASPKSRFRVQFEQSTAEADLIQNSVEFYHGSVDNVKFVGRSDQTQFTFDLLDFFVIIPNHRIVMFRLQKPKAGETPI